MTAVRECDCEVPHPGDNTANRPYASESCIACGLRIAERWTSNDKTLRAYLDRLADAIPGQGNPDTRSPAFEQFRLHVEARELAGRPRFGQSFLGRDNIAEAFEEAVDGGIYCALDELCAVRAGEGERDIDLVLTAAQHFYRAYEALIELRAKRRGTP